MVSFIGITWQTLHRRNILDIFRQSQNRPNILTNYNNSSKDSKHVLCMSNFNNFVLQIAYINKFLILVIYFESYFFLLVINNIKFLDCNDIKLHISRRDPKYMLMFALSIFDSRRTMHPSYNHFLKLMDLLHLTIANLC